MLQQIKIPKRRHTRRFFREEIIWPTENHMRRKAEILGGKINNRGKPIGFDVHSSTLPIDVYFQRGIIEARHHKAAMRYGHLRWALYGVTVAKVAHVWREVIPELIGDEEPAPERTPEDQVELDASRARRLYHATDILQRSKSFSIVRHVVLDAKFVAAGPEERLLRYGLELLADHWRIENDD